MPDEDAPDRITREDVLGLREDAQGLTQRIDQWATKKDVEDAVAPKASKKSVNSGAVLFVLFLLLAGWGQLNNHDRIDDIVSSKAQARSGLCLVLNDMRAKHNHFVETVIGERQAIIDQTDASPTASEIAKANTHAFFEAQIASYRTDLLPLNDCTDPGAVNAIFTTTTVPK